MNKQIFSLINNGVDKPVRYLGKEFNSIIKKNAKAKMLLAFPDIYEIGMSHFGSKILYDIVNAYPDYALERTYMTWKDFKSIYSMETYSCMSDFDAVGFSFLHELTYTNVLAMLDMGGLEIFASKRKQNHPIIIAGGSGTLNPSPMIDFIDAFVIGDAEPVILDILSILAQTASRSERLQELAKLKGVFVPSVHDSKHIIQKNKINSLDDVAIIKSPVVPYLETVHNRLVYEIQRGCNRGCRFCQAGMIERPVRQRNPQSIIDMLDKNIAETGYRSLGFLSLSACDYAPLLPLIKHITENYKKIGINLSLPSLRIESISDDFLNLLSRLPKGGFTIAPEAGSDKLRRVINKDIAESETLNTVEKVSSLGWDTIKSYFMIGLPTEDEQDVLAIIDLANKMERKLKNKRGKITVSVSNFIPKPHTPFQWEKQADNIEFEKKLSMLLSSLKNRRISLKWSDPKMSEIEGLLSRGDQKLGAVIYDVYKMGEIFSSWNSEFNYERWQNALSKNNLQINDYLAARDTKTSLPWTNIDTGIKKNWLLTEKQKAYSASMTLNCIDNVCTDCGVCDNKKIKNVIYNEQDNYSFNKDISTLYDTEKKYAIRGLFKKTDAFKWMGHFEIMALMEKALLKSGLPLAVSSGFKPSPLMSFCPPAGVGVESHVEMADLFFCDYVAPQTFLDKLNAILPEELAFKEVWKIPVNTASIFQLVKEYEWQLHLLNQSLNFDNIQKQFKELENKTIEVTRKQKTRLIDLKDFYKFKSISIDDKIIKVNFSLNFIDGKSVKPIEILKAVIDNINQDDFYLIRKAVRLDEYNTYY